MKRIKYLTFAFLILSLSIGLSIAQPYDGTLVITPTPTGQAVVTYYTIGAGIIPAPALGKNITAIQAFTTTGSPLPASIENRTIFIATNSNTSESIILTYVTILGTINEGVVTYQINSPIPFWINLTNAKVVDMNTAPTVINGTYWAFPAGNITISLIYQEKTTTPAQNTKSATQTQVPVTTSSTTPTQQVTTTHPENTNTPISQTSNKDNTTNLAIALFFIGGAIAVYLMTKQPKK